MRILKFGFLLSLVVSIVSCNQNGASSGIVTAKDSLSYALGSVQSSTMLEQLDKMDVKSHISNKWFLKGVSESLDKSAKMDVQATNVFISGVIQRMRQDSTFTFPKASQGAEMANISDSLSYSLGVNLMGSLVQGVDRFKITEQIDFTKTLAAITDVVTDSAKIAMKDGMDILNKTFKAAQEKIMAEKAKEDEVKFADNKKAGEEFLAKNKTKKGVITTESGLQYEILKKGNGAKPTANDEVKVHYTGTLIDGTVFDSSVERKSPAQFKVGGVIKGWTEALQLMNVGSKYKLYIPYALAYGTRAKGPKIKPFSTLVFEVELLDIVKK